LTIQANIRKLYAFSFLKMALLPMAIITLFWKDQIGLSLTDIMLLQGAFSLSTLLWEYPSGLLSDRFGYRWSLQLASLLGILGWGWYCFADSFTQLLCAEALLGLSFAFTSGSDSALLYETLKLAGREQDYSLFDGRMSGWAQAGEASGALFAGLLYAFAPLTPFILQVLIWVLALLICRSLVETPTDPPLLGADFIRDARSAWQKGLLESPPLRSTILLSSLLGMASFYPVWLIQPHMQAQGVPLIWFGPIWAGANATVALFSVLSHRLRYFFGLPKLVWSWIGLVAIGYAGLWLYQGLWCFLFYYLLTLMRGLQGPLLRHEIQQLVDRSCRASILSLKSLLFRLCFVATGPLVGLLADRQGLPLAFATCGGILLLLLIPLTCRFLSHPGRADRSSPVGQI
jgi:MFS family permease